MNQVKSKQVRKQALQVSEMDSVYVGLDVHKKSIHMAIRNNGQLSRQLVLPADYRVIGDHLEPLKRDLKRVVYEAGPTGYGLVRALRKRGFPVEVVDPTKMPRAAGQGSKSDGMDCRALAELAEKGVLPFVAVPTPEQEGQRQILRMREVTIRKIRRVKTQIKSFLLVHSIAEPKGLAYWSLQSVHALFALKLSEDLQFSLDLLLEELGHLTELRGRIDQRIGHMGREQEAVRRLRTHPGVGILTAMEFLCELHNPERFETKDQVACFLGLAPRVRQSGQTRREGPTIRAGQGTLRAKLVEACWSWIRCDPGARKHYNRLCANTGSGKKAVVAMARRMAVNLWLMTIRKEDYRAAA